MKTLHRIGSFIYLFLVFNFLWFSIFAISNWTLDLGDWNMFFRTIWVIGFVVSIPCIKEEIY